MFVDRTVTYVICDHCGAKAMIGENLNWNNRMNGCLANGFTFRAENGVFKNYCRSCKDLPEHNAPEVSELI